MPGANQGIDVVILCGGKGTRLRPSVSDRPKPMAEVGGKPFLDWLIDYAASFGLRRFVLCTGYLGEVIEAHYRQGPTEGREIAFSRESRPLGTGGAVKQALLSHCQGAESVLVLNGDTFCRIDYRRLIEFHADRAAAVSIAVAPAGEGEDQGLISLDQEQRIVSFSEKSRLQGHGFASAGIYLMRREVLELMPSESVFSLEFDLFPRLVQEGACYGYVSSEAFLDIGTPERYDLARYQGF